MKKAIVIYWSAAGNTERVAVSIHKGLFEGGVKSCFPFIENNRPGNLLSRA